MTRVEYERAYRAVRKTSPKLLKTAMTQVRQAYITAGDKVASELRIAQLTGASDLTVKSWQQIELQLKAGVLDITKSLSDETPIAVENVAGQISAVDEKWLTDANMRAGAGLSAVKIRNMFVSVNHEVLANMATRMFADGYTFSERVWRVGEAFPTDIKQVILSGLAQGRDPVKIADDLTTYIADGKVKLMKRYGKLEAGTKEFAKRIPKNVDYRAMRLVRTELYASLKEAGVLAGKRNPGAYDLFDWVMQAGRADWDCACPDLAHGSPYTAEQVPVQPHANCHPSGTMILTTDGKKPIEFLSIGDCVISYDGSVNKISKKFERMHTGDMYTFSTKDGEITATNEHPLLSNGSWVIAKNLKCGDNLTYVSRKIVPLSFAELKSLDYPSFGFKEFRLFVILDTFLGRVVPIPTIYLNGELYVWKSEINGKHSNYAIWDRLFSLFKNGHIKDELVLGSGGAFISLGSFDGLFIRHCSASNGLMGFFDMGLKAILIKPCDSLADIKRLESMLNKVPVNTASGQPKSFSDLVCSEILLTEQLDNHFLFYINSCTHSSTIVDVMCDKVNQKVYNIEVENTHSFIANGFASHNCGCYTMPRLRDADEFVDDLKRWSDGESVDYLDEWNYSYYGTIS